MEHEFGGRRRHAGLPAGTATLAFLLGLTGGAWLLSARLATPDMRVGLLTRGSMASMGGDMGMSASMSMGLSAFIAAWTVMMVAMMVPSALPAIRTFQTRADAMRYPSEATALFVAGYLLVWGAVGGAAYALVQVLDDRFAVGSATAFRAGAVLLLAAGLYQLTPMKQACLGRCRSSLWIATRPAGERRPGHLGTLTAGLRSGVYCLGSSWPLMLLLLLVGMMNLVWMGVVAAIIVAEKVLPGGFALSKALGLGLAVWGTVLLVAPHTAPLLGGA